MPGEVQISASITTVKTVSGYDLAKISQVKLRKSFKRTEKNLDSSLKCTNTVTGITDRNLVSFLFNAVDRRFISIHMWLDVSL